MSMIIWSVLGLYLAVSLAVWFKFFSLDLNLLKRKHWFESGCIDLVDNPELTWRQKIVRSAFWWWYFIYEGGWSMKIIGLVAIIAAISIPIYDLCDPKIYSLKPSDINEAQLKHLDDYQFLESMIGAGSWEEAARAHAGHCGDSPLFLRPASEYTEAEIIRTIKHPVQARTLIINYVMRNGILPDKKSPSFKDIHINHRPLDCYEAALIAAAALADDGFKPYLMSLRTPAWTFYFDLPGSSLHMVYVYKFHGQFGYISLQEVTPPIYSTLEKLAGRVSEVMQVKYTHYLLFNLDDACPGWLKSNPGINKKEVWRKF